MYGDPQGAGAGHGRAMSSPPCKRGCAKSRWAIAAEGVRMGPLVSQEQRTDVLARVAELRAKPISSRATWTHSR